MTVLFSATLSLPNLIYHMTNGEAILGNSEHDFAVLAIFLYALARLFSLLSNLKDEITDTALFAMGIEKAADTADTQ